MFIFDKNNSKECAVIRHSINANYYNILQENRKTIRNLCLNAKEFQIIYQMLKFDLSKIEISRVWKNFIPNKENINWILSDFGKDSIEEYLFIYAKRQLRKRGKDKQKGKTKTGEIRKKIEIKDKEYLKEICKNFNILEYV